MEFFSNFKWALPKAFTPMLAACRFERGDILYDTSEAYRQSTWSDALPYLTHSIQVKYPIETRATLSTETTRGAGETIKAGKFNQNWHSPVELELTDYKNNKKVTYIKTTQGRLYMLLWKGDLSVLDEGNIRIKPPLSAIELYSQLNTPHVENLIDATLFIMPYDPTSQILRQKKEKINSCLRNNGLKIAITEEPIRRYFPDIENDKIAPTVCLACFTIYSTETGIINDALKRALYIPSKNSKTGIDRFNLMKHGILI